MRADQQVTVEKNKNIPNSTPHPKTEKTPTKYVMKEKPLLDTILLNHYDDSKNIVAETWAKIPLTFTKNGKFR